MDATVKAAREAWEQADDEAQEAFRVWSALSTVANKKRLVYETVYEVRNGDVCRCRTCTQDRANLLAEAGMSERAIEELLEIEGDRRSLLK